LESPPENGDTIPSFVIGSKFAISEKLQKNPIQIVGDPTVGFVGFSATPRAAYQCPPIPMPPKPHFRFNRITAMSMSWLRQAN
jgi:hypothetical protein